MNTDLWRRLAIYIVIPALFISGTNAWRLWREHWEHKAHEPPVEERTEYPYMNIRSKAFPWGDGDKVSGPARNLGVSSELRVSYGWNGVLTYWQTLFLNENVNHHKKGEGE